MAYKVVILARFWDQIFIRISQNEG